LFVPLFALYFSAMHPLSLLEKEESWCIITKRPDLVWSGLHCMEVAMIVNTITEAKSQLSALIARVMVGEEVIIKKAGKPVAVLRKIEPNIITRKAGALKGKIRMSEDFDILPDDIAAAFGIEKK